MVSILNVAAYWNSLLLLLYLVIKKWCLSLGNYLVHLLFSDIIVHASCEETHTKNNNTISTPNYPGNYGNATHCTWQISAPPTKRVKINSFSYRIQSHPNCADHSLEIFDGQDENSSRLEHLCGNGTQDEIHSTGNTLFVKFTSNYSEDYWDNPNAHAVGFLIHYSLIGSHFWPIIYIMIY